MQSINNVTQTQSNKKSLSVNQYLLAHTKAINLIRTNNINIEQLYSQNYKFIVFKFNPTWDTSKEYELLFNLDSVSFYAKTPIAIMSSFIESPINSIEFKLKEDKRG